MDELKTFIVARFLLFTMYIVGNGILEFLHVFNILPY